MSIDTYILSDSIADSDASAASSGGKWELHAVSSYKNHS